MRNRMADMILRGTRGCVAWMVALLIGVSGCGRLDGAPGEGAGAAVDEEPLPFPGSSASLDELARRVVTSLVEGDTAALARLRLTEQEHNVIVWPEMPASRPEVGFPVDLAWTNIEQRSQRGLARTLPIFEGLALELAGVQCRGGTHTYASFHVLTDCWTRFGLGGREGAFEAQPFKDVLVRGGGHKVFRYYETRPARVEARGEG